jgi:hypothetical protein
MAYIDVEDMPYICAEDKEVKRGIGSAFHVGEGVFVTARHVVEHKQILEVRLTEALGLPTLDYYRDIEQYPDAEARAAEYEAAFTESGSLSGILCEGSVSPDPSIRR